MKQGDGSHEMKQGDGSHVSPSQTMYVWEFCQS